MVLSAFVALTKLVAASLDGGQRDTRWRRARPSRAASAFSSSVMSAGMSAIWRRQIAFAVSASIATIVVPPGAVLANSRAQASAPPPLVPVKMPSCVASSLDTSMARSPPTCKVAVVWPGEKVYREEDGWGCEEEERGWGRRGLVRRWAMGAP